MEKWKAIQGYEGMYEVSDRGRVKSYLCNKETIRIGTVNSRGYVILGLRKDKKIKTIAIHRLVLLNFRPTTEKLHAHHKNGIKTDNRLCNLEWFTCTEKARHAVRTGRRVIPHGENNYHSKLSNQDVVDIKKLRADGKTFREIANLFDISTVYAGQIINGQRRCKG
jgi:YesN/AraC family two-component response regulator